MTAQKEDNLWFADEMGVSPDETPSG
jgi:hypothetical protein